jgi:ArsR family transcriptional regulator, arsenate/arsenite/antimonite-responsive transcriptional repressor
MKRAASPADVFRALGDEHRLRILDFIARGDPRCCSTSHGICGCDVKNAIGLAQATVSHHLKILLEAQLISAEKHGRWVRYQLTVSGANIAQTMLEGLYGASPNTPEAPRD